MTADGLTFRFHHKADLHFKLGHLSWTYPFIVSENLLLNVIIGLYFIKFSRMIINVEEQKVIFPFDKELVLANFEISRSL